MVRKLVVLLTSVVLFAAAHAKALGLGEITLESALNQPLVARVELLQLGAVRPDQIEVSLGSQRDFDRFSVDRAPFLTAIEFNVETRGSDTFIRLTTQDPVREPFLSVVLDTRWPAGRVLSEYTMLLDLPSFANAAPAPVVEQPVASAVAPQQAQSPAPAQSTQPPVMRDSTPQAEESMPASDIVPLAANDGSVTVGTNDTLWDIALDVRPDSSVTVQQTMLALQRLNPEAFIADNINVVKRGQVLRVPDLAQIQALSARDAVSEVSRQNQLFENRRNVPLSTQPLAAAPSSDENATSNRGELSIVGEDSNDQNAGQAASSAREAEMASRIATLEDELAMQREETDAANRRAEELSERLSLLEEQIASAQEIIRLRDLELAQLQESLAQAQQDNGQPADMASAQAEAEQEAMAEEPAPETVITMAPEKSLVQTIIDTLMANTYALIGGAALIVLALVLLLLRRNKAKDEEALEDLDAMATEAEEEQSAEAEVAEEDANDAEPIEEGEPSDEAMDEIFDLAEGLDEEINDSFGTSHEAAEGHDAVRELLEEADTLIASERYDEAISLLQDGIVAEPDAADLRLKLLEVCVAKKDAVGFKLQETELRESASPEVIQRIEELKAQLREEVDDEILDDGEEEFFNELEDKDVDELELALDMDASAEVDDAKVEEEVAEEEEHFYSDDDTEAPELEAADEPSEPHKFSDDDIEAEEAQDDPFDLSTDSDEETIEFAVDEDVASDSADSDDEAGDAEDEENLVEFDFASDETPEADSEVSEEADEDENAIDFDVAEETSSEPEESLETTANAIDALEFGGAQVGDDADSEAEESDEEELSIDFEVQDTEEDASAEDAELESEASDDDEVVFDFGDTDAETDSAEETETEAADEDEVDWDLSTDDDEEVEVEFDVDEEPEAEEDDLEIDFAGLEKEVDESAVQFDLADDDDTEESNDAVEAVADEAADEEELVVDFAVDEEPEDEQKPDEDDEFADLSFLGDADSEEGDADDEEDDDFLSDADEAATKLDLARAYFEMDDKDGAKEILEEVIKEGSEEQIKDAKALLEKL